MATRKKLRTQIGNTIKKQLNSVRYEYDTITGHCADRKMLEKLTRVLWSLVTSQLRT